MKKLRWRHICAYEENHGGRDAGARGRIEPVYTCSYVQRLLSAVDLGINVCYKMSAYIDKCRGFVTGEL